jgi:hypothetical protein
MGEVLPLPVRGDVFADPRGEGRTLRVSWHQDEHTLVLSMWQLGQCRATFRLPSDKVPELVKALVGGLSEGLAAERENTESTAAVAFTKALNAAADPRKPADDEPTVPGVASGEPTVAAAETVAPEAVPYDGPVTEQTTATSASAAPAAVFLEPPAEG